MATCRITSNKVLCNNTNNTQHGAPSRLASNGHLNNVAVGKENHKKLDRSFSEPAEKKSLANAAAAAASPACSSGTGSTNLTSSRYKTELCRSFAEVGACKYGDKCQFAHGEDELRTITRHPKFKTENCKSFHSTGFCPYGPRCHFIHNDETSRKVPLTSSKSLNSSGNTQSISDTTSSGLSQRRLFDSPLGLSIAPPLSDLSQHHQNSMQQHHFQQQQAQSFMATNNAADGSNNKSVAANLIRPKALSLGSYSLGSSGEISSPSSQSGSPTSLNSFFTDEHACFGFGAFANATKMGNSNMIGGPFCSAANTFSFSPDSAFISFNQNNSQPASAGLAFGTGNMSTTNTNNNNVNNSRLAGKDMFGDAKSCLSMSDFNISEPIMIDETTNSVLSSLFRRSPVLSHQDIDSTFGETTSYGDYFFRAMTSPENTSSHKLLYPSTPESPVDSVASEIEALKLGEAQPSTFSPISSASSTFSNNSSLSASSSSPANGLADPFSSFQATSNIPRLPTFTKFAATATIIN